MTSAESSALATTPPAAPATTPTRRRPPPTAPTGREGPQPGDAGRLYAEHIKVQPRSVQGFWRRIKWWVLCLLLGLYYLGPWLRWDRGPGAPDQALLIDMPGRRAYFFFIEIWPQEAYYLTGLLIFGAIGLFLVTAWFGRVWCGFTCPQTVWTDLFMWVERKIEGDRNARIRLDKAPLSPEKIWKKTAKHVAWLLIGLATGGAWIMYFNDAPTVVREFFTGQASAAVYGFTAMFTMTTYVLAGWAREQVCIYMCPWPRFQGAMFDEDSYIVTYEEWRGEPRAPSRKGLALAGNGDCVDCGMCWQVCPTGVDIRKGQQMACIGCGLCIDACNSVMAKFGRPPELITYDSVNNQNARARGENTRTRLFRPRTIAYLALLFCVAAVIVYSLSTRSRLEVSVLSDRQPLFVKLSDGGIRNGYTFKILNMEREAKTFLLATEGLSGSEITVTGVQSQPSTSVEISVGPDEVGTFRIYVKAPPASLSGARTDFQFVLTDLASRQMRSHATIFNGP
ncbi:MAG: cytochrome c oxidase accessory protein CcoG [Rhodospirillales bacterium]